MSATLREIAGVVRAPSGRLSWLKILVLLLVLLPGASLALDLATQNLGPRPLHELILGTGLWTIRFLVITLAVTPARAVLDLSKVVMLRRMLGVACACYATAHFSLYVIDQRGNLYTVMTEILSRFYLTIGWVALMGLLVLAWTSTDAWQKSLGARWKKLHKLVFPVAVLGLLHYGIQSKADVSDMIFLTGLFLWLMFWRLVPRRLQTRLWPLPAFALGAGLLAAVIEAAWYAVRNNLPWDRVQDLLAANLDLSFGPRPAVAALLAGLLVAAVAAARRAWKRRRVAVGAMRRA